MSLNQERIYKAGGGCTDYHLLKLNEAEQKFALHTSLTPALQKGVIQVQTLDFIHSTWRICSACCKPASPQCACMAWDTITCFSEDCASWGSSLHCMASAQSWPASTWHKAQAGVSLCLPAKYHANDPLLYSSGMKGLHCPRTHDEQNIIIQ